jgi:hypothetical protein
MNFPESQPKRLWLESIAPRFLIWHAKIAEPNPGHSALLEKALRELGRSPLTEEQAITLNAFVELRSAVIVAHAILD